MMRRLLVAGLLLAGCHAHQIGETKKESMASAPKGQQVSSERPVRTTPGSMLDEKAMQKLQEALNHHGEKVKISGILDDQTQAALKRFQRKNSQPGTGLPDYDSIRRLGLDPKDIYLGGTYRREAERKSTKK